MISGLLIGFLFTWVVGLAPAIVIRWLKTKPIKSLYAYIISGIWCVLLAIVSLFLQAASGEIHPRTSPAWFLVFFVSVWWLRRPSAQRRREIIAELEAIAGNENADAERRAWAQEKLGRLKAGSKN